MSDYAIHVVLPDTQVKPGVPIDHLTWIGQYLVDHFAGQPNVKIVHLGDHADMPSLSSYDRGKKAMEGRRYLDDIAAANAGFDALCAPLDEYNATRRAYKEKQWWPERHIILGNHEDRISRACEDSAQLDGLLSLDALNYAAHGWTVHPFLKPLMLDGIGYAHFWANVMTGKPLGGMVLTRLKQLGHSFTMGHQQTLDYAIRFVNGTSQHGLVAGACLTPDHRVLTADLRYVPLGDLTVGDKLVSFDEDITGRRGRRYKTGTVEAVRFDQDEVFRVTLDNGKEFKVTADHLWLTRAFGPAALVNQTSYAWRRTDSMRVGTVVPQPLDEWDTDETFESGYLAGIYDGEGCLYSRVTTGGTVAQLSLAQKPGVVLDRAIAALTKLVGAESLAHMNQQGVTSIRLRGGIPTIAKMLGSIRPSRLLEKFEPEMLGRVTTNRNPKVVSIEPLGVQTIVRVAIDAKTMIVEGYGHHNCYLHDEDYKGWQGNAHWRGIVIKHEVRDGSYDPMFVSLDYLCRRYTGLELSQFIATKYPDLAMRGAA